MVRVKGIARGAGQTCWRPRGLGLAAFPGTQLGAPPELQGVLICKEAGKGLPQAPDGVRFSFVVSCRRAEEGRLREAEGVGQGPRLAWR